MMVTNTATFADVQFAIIASGLVFGMAWLWRSVDPWR